MTPSTSTVRPIEILLIEDNQGDIELTRQALKEGLISNRLVVEKQGEVALEYLRTAEAQPPDLILLDLNLPGMDGKEVLRELKADANLARIPVVVLTTSRAEVDVLEAYDLHANCYVSKPLDFEQFAQVVLQIENFWFSIVVLPGRI